MRMRRKKNLDERAEDARPYLLWANTDTLDARQAIEDKKLVDLSCFDRSRPLVLELGCGKGKFALDYTEKYPDQNYLAVEKLTNVIIVGAENAKSVQRSNLRFLCTGAEYLQRFLPSGSIDKIIINFPCPFHKETYHEKRLTDKRFLAIYDDLLKENGEIFLKTDNRRMFAYSIEQMSAYGLLIDQVSLDLHNSPYNDDNIMTEYEKRYTDEGLPIFRLRARRR